MKTTVQPKDRKSENPSGPLDPDFDMFDIGATGGPSDGGGDTRSGPILPPKAPPAQSVGIRRPGSKAPAK